MKLQGQFAFAAKAIKIIGGWCLLAASLGMLAACGSSAMGGGGGNPPVLNTISVTPQNGSVAVKDTQQFSATGNYSDGSTKDLTSSASWLSSNTANATIETTGQGSPGLATGVASGSVTITASYTGVNGTAQLAVTSSATLQSVAVTPQSTSVTVGNTAAFTATGSYSDGSMKNITLNATWTSSNTAEATIQTAGQANPGVAIGVATGGVTITATLSGVSGTASLTINPNTSTLQSIAVAPANPSIAVGITQQFTATGSYSDGSKQNLTASAAWSSSITADATIQTTGQANPGLAIGVAAGSPTITASQSGVSGNTTLTVTSGSGNTTPIPLNDMTAADNYLNFAGGLYENSTDKVPSDHDTDGRSFAAQVQPLDTNGNPSATGQIIFVSFGMSNAAIEFGSFSTTADGNPKVNQTTLHITNGAFSEQDACYWFPAFGPPSCNSTFQNEYDRISNGLTSNGLSPNQVQVAWIDNANGRVHSENRGCVPMGTLCNSLCDPATPGCVNNENTTNALNEEEEFAECLRAAKTRFPNLKLVLFSSRVYGGYTASSNADPEPFAYETAYAIKWLIQAQINQVRTGSVDPTAGDLSYTSAPWIAWANCEASECSDGARHSAYFWANGDKPRSDGLVWCNGQTGAPCNGEDDFGPDGLHLSTTGGDKAANLLLNYFLTSPYTKSWFAAP
ncbi:MAG TPA: Ig-like domain-containing protein [Candidatus Acidoferrales bacterium]|nr:Ig-like domain-containing protein [Candidatus Acidoferrales bacterium]